jgi:hypothetical protein
MVFLMFFHKILTTKNQQRGNNPATNGAGENAA